MPERRLEAATAALGTRLVIAGGFSSSGVDVPITRKVLTLDTLNPDPETQWGTLPDLPVEWTHANLAAIGGVLFLLGGLEGRGSPEAPFVARGEVFVLEAEAEAWEPLPSSSMPAGEERGAAAVVAAGGHIYLLGGASSTGVLSSSLDFDLISRSWSVMPIELPGARSHAAAMQRFDGMFIIAGGLGDPGNRPLGDVFALPLGATLWEPRDEMETRRGGCGYGVVFGSLICAGGELGGATASTEIYDPTLDRWTTQEAMPEPRAGAPGTVVSNRLYIPGGSASIDFDPTDSLFVFSPTVR
jgi:hypothetical protein